MKNTKKKIKAGGTSTGEVSVIFYLNQLFNTEFVKIRPDWLLNPKTGFNLELDGYSDDLKIGIEYGSHKASSKNCLFFGNQKYIQFKDGLKRKLCEKNGVKLIHIPDLPLSSSKLESFFKDHLIQEFKRLDIEIPKSIDSLSFKIKERPDAYSKKYVMSVVRQCKDRTQFERGYRGVWRAAERLGLIEGIVESFRNKKNPTFFEEKNEVNIAKKAKLCKTRTEFAKKYSSYYQKSIELGILDKVCKHMKSVQRPFGYWNVKSNVDMELKKMKGSKFCNLPYSLRESLHKNKWISLTKKYNIVIFNKGSIGFKNNDHLKNTCKKEALKFKGRLEFSNKNTRLYKIASKNGWLDEIFSHMTDQRSLHLKLDDTHVLKLASKFNSFSEFRIAYPNLAKKATKSKLRKKMVYASRNEK